MPRISWSRRHNLAQAPLLHLESRAGSWAEWFERAGLAGAPRQDGRYFDQHSMVIAAATAGLGAAIVPYDMVAREIAGGDLMRIPGPALESRKRYYPGAPARGGAGGGAETGSLAAQAVEGQAGLRWSAPHRGGRCPSRQMPIWNGFCPKGSVF